MTVDPQAFIEAMNDHWTNTLGNVASKNLRAIWQQLAETLNAKIRAYDGDLDDYARWKILQPKTDTGKTQGLAVYCSMLPTGLGDAPGVLIVTRLKAEADGIVEDINRLAGNTIAATTHSSHKIAPDQLKTYPILVVTHEAFRLSMDAINKGDHKRLNWDSFMALWTEQWQRKLVVVDEALDIVDEAQITARDVRLLEAVIPPLVRDQFGDQIAAMELVREVLENLELRLEQEKENDPTAKASEQVVSKSGFLPEEVNFTGLRKALREVRLDIQILRRDDRSENQRLFRRYDAILKGVVATLENWNWYAKTLNNHTLNSARLIIPDDGKTGAVVLDATAERNLIYKLFQKRADVIRAPAIARRYDNVTLHVSRGHKVGKVSLTKVGASEGPKFVSALQRKFGKDRRVLVLCHKFVAPHFEACQTHFERFEVGTWGSVAGRNDWRDCDVVAVFGLPIRPDTWSANVFMALQGLQTTKWLNGDQRPFENYTDIRRSLRTSQTVVDVIQGINRARCRKVVDAEGHCAPTDVVMLLPNGRIADEYLDSIHLEMSGLHQIEWDYNSETKRKARRSNFVAALVAYGAAMREGRKSASDIKRELAISNREWMRLAAKLKDKTSDLAEALILHGITYEVSGIGRGSRSYLKKVVH